MEDTWLCIEEDSSDHSFSDSDVIDSETEAELYSLIHYEENLSHLDCNVSEVDTVQTSNVPVLTTDKVNSVFCAEKNRESMNTKSVVSLMNISPNDVNSVVKEKLTSQTKFLSKLAQKLSPVRKKKSNFDLKLSNDLYSDNSENTNFNQSFMDTSLNNKLKRRIGHNSQKDQSSAKKSKVLFDSSDSDSFIWTEVDSSEKKDFQTNLYKDEDTVCISSDYESDILHISKTREASYRNLSMPNIKIGEKSKDIWFVNDKDLVRQTKSKSRRYHEISCSNCNRKGHNFKICPMPRSLKCFICGGGGHIGTVCAKRICGRCYRFGHDSKRCWMPYVNYCTLCSMKGHCKQNCTDIWRRYHLTTQLGKIIRGQQLKQDKFPFCWNCGETGHYGVVCKQYRELKDCLPTWPCVVSYDDPEDILRMRVNGRGRRGNFRKDKHSNQRNEPNEACNLLAEGKKKKKKNKLNLQHFKNLKALREKDFPRTPKNNSLSNISDDVPESVSNFLSNKVKRKEKRRNRKLKKRQLLMKKIASEHSLQADT